MTHRTLDPDILKAIDELHYCTTKGNCVRCGHPYPCDSKLLLEHIHATASSEEDEPAYDPFESGFDEGYSEGYADKRAADPGKGA